MKKARLDEAIRFDIVSGADPFRPRFFSTSMLPAL